MERLSADLINRLLDIKADVHTILRLASVNHDLQDKVYSLIPVWIEQYFKQFKGKQHVSCNNMSPNQMGLEIYFKFNIIEDTPHVPTEETQISFYDPWEEFEEVYTPTTYQGLYEYLLKSVPHNQSASVVFHNAQPNYYNEFKSILKIMAFQRFSTPKPIIYIDD